MLKLEDVPQYLPKIYNTIALNDLVTYAVFHLTQCGERRSAENITAAAYLMFPQRFALRGYPQWPDSSVVNKRWIDCRNKGLITGSTAADFSLTPKGLNLAEKVSRILNEQRPVFKRSSVGAARTEIRTRAGRFVRAIEDSEAYALFREKGEKAAISEYDFRSMLLCTMESSATTLNSNLGQFKQYVLEYERDDLIKLLEYCEMRFALILKGGSQGTPRGGMLYKKNHDGRKRS